MKINGDPMRTPNARALITVYPGAAALKELDRHTPRLSAVTHNKQARWWTCSCEVDPAREQLPPVRLATTWESHVLAQVVAVILGIPPERTDHLAAGIHHAHYQRVALAERTEKAPEVLA